MMNEKMVAAIEKKVGKVVDGKAEQEGKDIKAEVRTEDKAFEIILSERKNQYGSYYRVLSIEEKEIPVQTVEAPTSEEPKEEIDEAEAMANLQAAQKFSESKNTPVFVMSNGKRTAVVKTDANKARHEKYGYWIAATFENGVQVPA